MKLYATEYAAARAYAARHGITGRGGGWLYFADGTRHQRVPGDPHVKGWTALGDALVEAGILVADSPTAFKLVDEDRSIQPQGAPP